MSANDNQVGGNHYSEHGTKELQHWDVVRLFHLGYFEGNITKYVFRWRCKGGVQDLRKARHYLDKLIEIEEQKEDHHGAEESVASVPSPTPRRAVFAKAETLQEYVAQSSTPDESLLHP
jgi:hypothetical protein